MLTVLEAAIKAEAHSDRILFLSSETLVSRKSQPPLL